MQKNTKLPKVVLIIPQNPTKTQKHTQCDQFNPIHEQITEIFISK